MRFYLFDQQICSSNIGQIQDKYWLKHSRARRPREILRGSGRCRRRPAALRTVRTVFDQYLTSIRLVFDQYFCSVFDQYLTNNCSVFGQYLTNIFVLCFVNI